MADAIAEESPEIEEASEDLTDFDDISLEELLADVPEADEQPESGSEFADQPKHDGLTETDSDSEEVLPEEVSEVIADESERSGLDTGGINEDRVEDSHFETFSEDDLGEFGEDDALAASLEEQRELESYYHESRGVGPEEGQADMSVPAFDSDDEKYQVGGLDMDALLNDPEMLLAEELPLDTKPEPDSEPDELEIEPPAERLDVSDNLPEESEPEDAELPLDELEEDYTVPEDEEGIWLNQRRNRNWRVKTGHSNPSFLPMS